MKRCYAFVADTMAPTLFRYYEYHDTKRKAKAAREKMRRNGYDVSTIQHINPSEDPKPILYRRWKKF